MEEKTYGYNLTKECHKWVLTEEEERNLYPLLNDSNKEVREYAKDTIYKANIKLVIELVNKNKINGVCFDDCLQEGLIGMRNALERFDYTKGYRFGTYAWNDIQAAITRYTKSEMSKGNLSEDTTNKLLKLKRVMRELVELLGVEESSLTEDFVMDECEKRGLDIPSNKIGEYMRMNSNLVNVSIDTSSDDEQESNRGIINTLADEENVAKSVQRELDANALWKNIGQSLTEKESSIIWMRFKENKSFDEIGEMLGCSKQNVNNIYKRALEHLQATASIQDFKTMFYS